MVESHAHALHARVCRAVEEEDYATAGVLAAGTSRRGRLCEELVEAVAQERYGDAAST